MNLSLALALVLTAGGAEPIKLATTEFLYSELPAEKGAVLLEYFTQQLVAQGDIRVTTERDVQDLLGRERQRQLMGCGDSSACLVELAGALGADGLITGALGKVGTHYTVSVRVMRAENGSLLAAANGKVKSEDELLEFFALHARLVADKLKAQLRPQLARSPGLPLPVWATGGASAALLAGSGVCFWQAEQRARTLKVGEVPTADDAPRLKQEGFLWQAAGWTLVVAGGAAAATAAVMAVALPRTEVTVAIAPGSDSLTLGIAGRFP